MLHLPGPLGETSSVADDMQDEVGRLRGLQDKAEKGASSEASLVQPHKKGWKSQNVNTAIQLD
jgi:hypothetical protein